MKLVWRYQAFPLAHDADLSAAAYTPLLNRASYLPTFATAC